MGAPQKDDKLSFWRWSNQRKNKTTVNCESEKSRTVTKKSVPGTSNSLQENQRQTLKMKPHRRSHGLDRPEREREDETVVIESGRSPGALTANEVAHVESRGREKSLSKGGTGPEDIAGTSNNNGGSKVDRASCGEKTNSEGRRSKQKGKMHSPASSSEHSDDQHRNGNKRKKKGHRHRVHKSEDSSRNKRREEHGGTRKRRHSPSSDESSYSSDSSGKERRKSERYRKEKRGMYLGSRGDHSSRHSGWRRNSKRDGAERYSTSSSEYDADWSHRSKQWKDSREGVNDRRGGGRHAQQTCVSNSSEYSSDDFSSDEEGKALVDQHPEQRQIHPNSYRRRESRRKLTSLKKEASRRQSEGKKPYFVVVDSDTGEVYGNGLKNWKKEVKKISYSLDPSVVDVRRFPKEKLREAREKLAEKFEYSSKLSKGFFRSVLGRALSQRRNAVLALIESGIPCPLSFDERVWNTLKKYKDDPATQKKREDSQRARASRGSGGRTGSLGESGIRNKLAELLGRSPDPEEVETEMRRDKGSAGRKRKTAVPLKPGAIETSASRELVGVEQHAGQKPSEDPPTPEQRMTKEDVLQHPFVQSLWNELQMLKAKETQGTDSGAPPQPIPEGGESNSAREKTKVNELIHKNANGDAGDPSRSGTEIPCVAEDLTRKTRSKATSKKSTPTVDKQNLRK